MASTSSTANLLPSDKLPWYKKYKVPLIIAAVIVVIIILVCIYFFVIKESFLSPQTRSDPAGDWYVPTWTAWFQKKQENIIKKLHQGRQQRQNRQ
jgi:hypothetical protein